MFPRPGVQRDKGEKPFVAIIIFFLLNLINMESVESLSNGFPAMYVIENNMLK